MSTKKGKPKATTLDEIIGQKLRYLRVNKGLALKDIAEILGVTTQQVQKYEKGVNRLSLTSFITLAQKLKIDPFLFLESDAEEVVELPNYNEKQIQAIREFTEAIQSLDSETVKSLLAIVKALKTNA